MIFLRKTVRRSYIKQNNSDLVFQTRTSFLKCVSSRDQNVIFKIMNYLFLNRKFSVQLQSRKMLKRWCGNIYNTTERNYQTFNKI